MPVKNCLYPKNLMLLNFLNLYFLKNFQNFFSIRMNEIVFHNRYYGDKSHTFLFRRHTHSVCPTLTYHSRNAYSLRSSYSVSYVLWFCRSFKACVLYSAQMPIKKALKYKFLCQFIIRISKSTVVLLVFRKSVVPFLSSV